jgi:riboflavin kinase/FMN adenylyltransferase
LETTGLALPPKGVYAAQVQWQNKTFVSVLNIGVRPTLHNPEPQLRVEVHLLDFNSDLYDQELELTFVEKLRDEQRFPSLAALQSQIQGDITAARKIFDVP